RIRSMMVCSSAAGSAVMARRRAGAIGKGPGIIGQAPAAHRPAAAGPVSCPARTTPDLRMFNRTTAYILAAALAAGLGLLAAFHLLDRDTAAPAPELQTVTLLPQPRQLPAFNLRQS